MSAPRPHSSAGRLKGRQPQDGALSIQFTLRLAFMAVTIFMAVAMCLSSLVLAHRSALRQATAHLASVAAIRESALLAWNGQLQADMTAVLPPSMTKSLAADTLEAGPDDPMQPQRRALFSSMLARAATASAYFDEFSLVDPQGVVAACSQPEKSGRPSGLGSHLLTGQTAPTTEIFPPPPGSAEPGALLARPILDDTGGQIGLLTGTVRPAHLNNLLGSQDVADSVRVFLANTSLELLYPARFGGLSAGEVVTTEGARLAKLTHQGGDGVYNAPSGEEVVGVWSRIAPLGVTLFAEQELRLALLPMRETIWTALATAMTMVVVAFLAAGPLAAYLSTPLTGLAEAARRIARGDLGSRAPVQGQAEVRLLAEAFNYMAARLAWRIEAENLLGSMAKRLLPAAQSHFALVGAETLGDLCRFLRSQSAVLAVFDGENHLEPVCTWPLAEDAGAVLTRTALLLKRAAALKQDRSAVVLPTLPGDDPALTARGLFFAAFAPVIKEGSPWGMLCVERAGLTTFDQDEMALLERAGEVLGMAVERVRAESARAATESKYRQLFENAAEAIFQTTPSGAVLDANPAAARLLGYASAAEMIAGVADIARQHYVYPDIRREVVRVLCDQGEIQGFEILFRDVEGRRIWSSVNAQAVMGASGRLERLDVRADDITARKAAESQRDRYVAALARKNEALARAKGFITDIFDSMPSFLVSLDENGRMTEINREAARTGNLARQDALDRPFGDVFPALKDIMKDFRMATAQLTPLVRRQVTQGDSGARHLDVVVYPLMHGASGAVVRVDDVTERVRIEEMMVQSEKMLSVGGLAAGMAHEINNPLAGILHSIQVIQRRLSPDMEANREAALRAGCSVETLIRYLELRNIPDFLHNISESGSRAAKIVSNMLEFSRHTISALLPHDLHAVIEQALELAASDYNLSKKFDFKHIAIERDFDPSLPPTPCAPSQIQQVLLNILSNAAQAMARQEGARPPARITLRTRRQDAAALIEIGDNGPGMDEETRRRVFEPFFTTKPVGMGTGLGLSVSYFIVTRTHGGGLSVESSPGAGSVFRITLPLSVESGQAPRK